MSPTDHPTPANRILSIARHLPGTYLYTRTVLLTFAASRMARMGIYTPDKKIVSSLGILKALERIGVDLRVENMAAYRALEAPCVFVSNHMSVLETFLFPCLIMPYRKFTFVLKRSLTDYPFFKHIIRSLDPIVVERTNPREDLRKVLADGVLRLKKNISVLIFPQNTRSFHFDPKNFNSLGVKLARRADVPVIPVAVKTDAWGIGRLLKDLGKIDPTKFVRISFGNPIYIADNDKAVQRQLVDFITDRLSSWGII